MRHRRLIALGVVATVLLAGCSATTPDPSSAQSSTTESAADTRVKTLRTDFQITYKLDGESRYSQGVRLISNQNLALVPTVGVDVTVTEGEIVGDAVVREDVAAALEASAMDSSIDTARLERLRSLEGPIKAPVGGVFAIEGTAPVISSQGIDVVVALTPIQDLRYQSLRFTGEAVIETIVGERAVDCEAVWIEAQVPANEEIDNGPQGRSAELHCRLPNYIETASGLRARIILRSEVIEDAIVVPNIYVGYDDSIDEYFIRILQDGRESKVPVSVGVTDGVVRVITSDVPIGAQLLPLDGL